MAGHTDHADSQSTRRLHVAALPYPTNQGTQAAVSRITAAHATGEHPVALLTYGSRAFLRDEPFEVLRSRALPGRDRFTSGPSLRKLAHNVALARTLRRSLRPGDLLIAHHVEAATLCALTTRAPFAFFAHTGLSKELPDYFPTSMGAPLTWAGAGLDTWLCRRAALVLAISPLLAAELSAQSGKPAHYVPTPWPLAALIPQSTRRARRYGLDMSVDTTCLVYIGNLDRYQGWWRMFEALAWLRHNAPTRRFELHVYTQSPCSEARAYADREGVLDHVRFFPLPNNEDARIDAYAAADLVVVPRKTPGGLPIKLLDAMARGLPIVATTHATAGLELGDMIRIASDEGASLGATILNHVEQDVAQQNAMAARGRAHIGEAHSEAHVRARLETLITTHLAPQKPCAPKCAHPD